MLYQTKMHYILLWIHIVWVLRYGLNIYTHCACKYLVLHLKENLRWIALFLNLEFSIRIKLDRNFLIWFPRVVFLFNLTASLIYFSLIFHLMPLRGYSKCVSFFRLALCMYVCRDENYCIFITTVKSLPIIQKVNFRQYHTVWKIQTVKN